MKIIGLQNKMKKQNIDIDFINLVSQLEMRFFQKDFNEIMVKELICRYGQLVEKYDLLKDPICSYFLQKIQFILSQSYIIDFLKHKPQTPQSKPRKYQEFQQKVNLIKVPINERNSQNIQKKLDFKGLESLQKEYEQQKMKQNKILEQAYEYKKNSMKLIIPQSEVSIRPKSIFSPQRQLLSFNLIDNNALHSPEPFKEFQLNNPLQE